MSTRLFATHIPDLPAVLNSLKPTAFGTITVPEGYLPTTSNEPTHSRFAHAPKSPWFTTAPGIHLWSKRTVQGFAFDVATAAFEKSQRDQGQLGDDWVLHDSHIQALPEHGIPRLMMVGGWHLGVANAIVTGIEAHHESGRYITIEIDLNEGTTAITVGTPSMSLKMQTGADSVDTYTYTLTLSLQQALQLCELASLSPAIIKDSVDILLLSAAHVLFTEQFSHTGMHHLNFGTPEMVPSDEFHPPIVSMACVYANDLRPTIDISTEAITRAALVVRGPQTDPVVWLQIIRPTSLVGPMPLREGLTGRLGNVGLEMGSG